MSDSKITIDNSANQIVYHNPAIHPLPVSAGQPITATTKPVGQPNAVVHGQVSGTTVVIDNPA
jgi:hypothetical protein